MNSNTPQLLKGFRDFLPEEKRKRDYVTAKIKEAFELFGFEPLETPTLEYASLLLGKYGEEADKLVYKFLDRGGREIALRYDQTVPTARVLSQYRNELPQYFRRYQIQNVFRADKPQKGRYREFTQCDIDIFGSTDPLSDAEVLACTYFSYKNIGFRDIRLALNDRATLFSTLEPFSTTQVSIKSIIQSIDKLDKSSQEAVIEELIKKGLTTDNARQAFVAIQNAKPSEELRTIVQFATQLGVSSTDLPITSMLARGLDYYTGMIFEVFSEDLPSSFGGGGRYDGLIEQLGGPSTPAVGMAIGFDRTVEAADQLGLLPAVVSAATVLVTVFDESTRPMSLQVAAKLRESRVAVEVFPAMEKLDKQLKYADKKGIPYVIILGPEEVEKGMVTVKDMKKKTQEMVKIAEIDKMVKAV